MTRRAWSARGLAKLASGCFCRGEAPSKTCLTLQAFLCGYIICSILSSCIFVQIQSAGFEFGRKTEGADRELFRLFGTEEADWSEFRLTLALSLLVLGVLADDHDFTLALDDLALLAHGLDGRSDFHL